MFGFDPLCGSHAPLAGYPSPAWIELCTPMFRLGYVFVIFASRLTYREHASLLKHIGLLFFCTVVTMVALTPSHPANGLTEHSRLIDQGISTYQNRTLGLSAHGLIDWVSISVICKFFHFGTFRCSIWPRLAGLSWILESKTGSATPILPGPCLHCHSLS